MSAVINELILDLKKKLGVTSIVITHDMKSAFEISNTMVMLYDGKVELAASAEEFKNTKNPYAKQFIEGSVKGPIQMAITK
jgi:phospholipid/cholesterol/gamma-HCH transport system ATP-binding protein